MRLFRRTSNGQSAVELALMAPVLFTLLLAAGDYARVFFKNIEVSDAARAGAQYGSQRLVTSVDTTGIASAAVNDASDIGITASNVSSSTYCTCTGSTTVVTCGPSACATPTTEKVFVKVSVTATFNTAYTWGIWIHGIYMGLPTSTALKATSELQVQP